MVSTLDAAVTSHGTPSVPVATVEPGRRARTLPPDWPLVALIVGFPLWWILGLANAMPFLLAIPMARQLLNRSPIRLPAGFSWWLLFLVCVVASAAALWAEAPGAVPGGAGGGRLIVFGYRLLWYLTCTVVVLWIANMPERDVSTTRVVRLLGGLFVITVMGGLLGVFAPRFEVTSIVESLLPQGLKGNAFVRSLVHPAASQQLTLEGTARVRPMAPFAYANSWGSNLTMTIPFFIIGAFGRSARRWQRFLAPAVLVLAAIPIVMSLNRMVWATLVFGVVFVVGALAARGRVMALVATAAGLAIGATIFLASPLGQLVGERLENAHSNDRRGDLLTLTVESTVRGSPLIGFGSTRDVQGSFTSIAGGSTPDCRGCGVPPIGTQGQIWLVIFSQGFIGTTGFVGFYLAQLRRHWRLRTTLEATGVLVVAFSLLQSPTYDTLGMPLYVMMIGIALMWRERFDREPTAFARGTTSTLESVARLVRGRRVAIVVAITVGAIAGGVLTTLREPVHRARATVLLQSIPVQINLDGDPDELTRDITVDTEAALLYSERTINETVAAVGLTDAGDLRGRVDVTAAPNTRVLQIDVTDTSAKRAEETVRALTEAYLDNRQEQLGQRRQQVLSILEEQLTALDGDAEGTAQLSEIRDAINATPDTAGEVLRFAPSWRVRNPRELYVVSGAVVGLVAGWVAIAIANSRRRPRRGGAEVQQLTRTQGAP